MARVSAEAWTANRAVADDINNCGTGKGHEVRPAEWSGGSPTLSNHEGFYTRSLCAKQGAGKREQGKLSGRARKYEIDLIHTNFGRRQWRPYKPAAGRLVIVASAVLAPLARYSDAPCVKSSNATTSGFIRPTDTARRARQSWVRYRYRDVKRAARQFGRSIDGRGGSERRDARRCVRDRAPYETFVKLPLACSVGASLIHKSTTSTATGLEESHPGTREKAERFVSTCRRRRPRLIIPYRARNRSRESRA